MNSLLTEVYPRLNDSQRERVLVLVHQWNRLKADLLVVAHPALAEPHLNPAHSSLHPPLMAVVGEPEKKK